MLANLKMTVTESIRYRGRSGHYSWLAHRLSGLAILGFLALHTWDTANAYWFPNAYRWSIDLFKHPFFGAGEIAIMGAVFFHAFNGIRITLLDFKPEWWHYQKRSVTIVWTVFLLLFIPAAAYLLIGIVASCGEPPVWAEGLTQEYSCWSIPPTDIARYSQ